MLTRFLRPTLLALTIAALAVPAQAHPIAPVFSNGTLVAHAFSGCVPGANCDVIGITLDAGAGHTVFHAVAASHSSGNPPAYRLYLRLGTSVGLMPIPGCPDLFTPGAGALSQNCLVPPQPVPVKVVSVFEALRPHQVGTVGFNHGIAAL